MKTSVVLLCSGSSSRMNPFENKFLFEFHGKSMFRHQMENICLQENVEEIFVVANSENISLLQNEIDTYFSSEQKKITCTLQENSSDGMKGGVLSVENIFPKNNSIAIISSNDMVENWFLKDFLSDDSFPHSLGKICGKKVGVYFPGGYLQVDSEQNVKTIIEKPGEGNEPSDMINLVFHWFRDSELLLSVLQETSNENDDAYEQTIQKLIDSGNTISAVEYNGKWQALKYPWHVLDMKEFFDTEIQSFIHPSSFVSENAVIRGDIYIEEGVKIHDFAVVNGPCYIGKNTIIGNHCLVRESYVGEECCIGQGSEIARSYLRNKVFTHQSYIGDSVVDNNCNFGAGCKTGNLRHDGGEVLVTVKKEVMGSGKNKLGIFCGKDARFGINTSFAPGVSIGKNCWSYPHLFLSEKIEDNSFIKPQKESLKYIIKENKNT